MTPEWLKFEEAIAAFCQALAPDAKVTHNVIIPDVDTGEPRQRDVWIEASLGGHIPIRVLVSCKRLKRKLDSQHMDAVIGELASSGANKGVIYAAAGFTQPALAKAAKRGISCCILLVDRPPPIPDMLLFEAYHLHERFRLTANGLSGAPDWAAMLNGVGEYGGEAMPAYRALARIFADDLPVLQQAIKTMPAPIRQVGITLRTDDGASPVRLGVQTEWAVHRARMEAWLVNGSYSFTDSDFKGSIATPSIDTWNAEPGPGWEPIKADAVVGDSMFRFYKLLSDIGPALAAMAGHAADGMTAPDTAVS